MTTGISPITGWTRESWTRLADHMLRALRPYASPGHGRITLPGPPGGLGTDVDGLEGFARTFLLAGFRLAGENGREPENVPGLAGWYAEGIAAGTDPSASDRWIRPDEHRQAKVEAASIALILDLTRPWIWDQLSSGVQERVVDYLATVVGDDDYPRNNWLWFRLVVQTFLWSVGGPWSPDDVEADLALHDAFYRADGWYADGDERAFDHYVGWAMHLYPILWMRMRGMPASGGVDGHPGGAAVTPATLAAQRGDLDTWRLRRFLQDYVRLIGGDGSPLVQGRSLTYRFAAAASLWAGALAGIDEPGPGALRRAASGIVDHFTRHAVPDERGLLTLGWHHEWPGIAQSYSGPSSPYWAAKGMLGLALPADHPAWTATEQPLPAEGGDHVWAAPVPSWLISSTRDDGIVRVVNHGTDHALPGSSAGDSPLYARLGYSTATAPLMSPDAWESPVDQSVTLLDADGRATHRAGMQPLRTDILRTESADETAGDDGSGSADDATGSDGGPRCAAVGASVARARWVVPAPGQRDHGSGRSGEVHDAGAVSVLSVVRGAWEIRCVRVDALPEDAKALSSARRLRIGGWPIADASAPRWTVDGPRGDGRERPRGASRTAEVTSARAVSVIVVDEGFDEAGVHRQVDASPLGAHSATPWVAGPVTAGVWHAVVIGLYEHAREQPPQVDLNGTPDGAATRLRITWPGGQWTVVDLPEAPAKHVPARVVAPGPAPDSRRIDAGKESTTP
ncbi:DUF2264 domain-containing protein [Actinobacteria bacterium YIM 96077]|uniref:DUF2264 domain-containing protein n=1 Tax=Phytoactinopolyspora halophila TaxID=1981511 RepID=A0A329QU45_9ACTN|nr:DUF2264 domain-containing protein [Phytoactinopolyspora halophila]AYY13887.1 DUF2264 domain-containing protein [Actinobacteria bacterium YIM 96077]RAW15571.1 hypothetical protein DPM12_07885 [Phytoactinopolyspora halophila]